MAGTVQFTRMADGTTEDYQLLRAHELEHVRTLPDRILAALEAMRNSIEGYQIDRLEHVLQTATRAFRAGESEDYVVAALVHDIGDMLAPGNHSAVAAAILEPYVDAELVWIVRHHGLFQTYYYATHYGEDPNARDRYLGHPSYEACRRFCENYDQSSFDPNYPTEPLEFFEPMVRRVFALDRRNPDQFTNGRRRASAAYAPLPFELQPAGDMSSAGTGRWALLFGQLAVTAQYWTQHDTDGDEIGVRVELQEVENRPGTTEFDAAEILVHAPVWRADLFTLATGQPGNWDRAHFHPRFNGRNPGTRNWDATLTGDPLVWLGKVLSDLRPSLEAAGRPQLADLPEARRIETSAPIVVATVRAMFEQAPPLASKTLEKSV